MEALTESNRKIIQDMNDIKIDRLRVEEAKRREIEQLRQSQHNDIVAFREKNEK